MKKLISLLSVAMLATSVFATNATEKRMAYQNLPVRNNVQVSLRPDCSLDLTAIQPDKQQIANAINPNATQVPMKVKLQETATKPSAYYNLPMGVYYCGIDKRVDYIWWNVPTVVGACFGGQETWVWPSGAANGTVSYKTILDQDYPDYAGEGWSMDAQGNYIDSMAATNFGKIGYYMSLRMPLQTVTDGENTSMFYRIGEGTARIDTALNFAVNTMAGAFNPIASDDMWPLTNAMFSTPFYGPRFGSVYDVDEKHNVSFIYGTEPIALPTYDTTYVDETKTEIAKIDTIYNDTVQASALISSYDQPMAPLYIKDVTVALFNKEYDAVNDTILWEDIKIDSLVMVILNMKGQKIATALATKEDTASMMMFPGQLVTFKIQEQDDLGAIIEGVTVNEPFMVAIYGLNRPGNRFGVWSAISPYNGGSKTAVLSDKGEVRQYAYFDPFIMVNGIYYTMEHAARTPYIWNVPASYTSDTINVNVYYDEEYDEYWVGHADGPFEGNAPVLRSMELLYDTVSKQYNYNLYGPDWAQYDMDGYDEYPYSGDVVEGHTWWSDFNVFWIIIWGDASDTSVDAPAVGDEIKIAKYGREIIFKVVAVEDKPQGINNVIRTVNDNKLYNVLGIEVDKDYKGVVIRNGQKFLQR